MLVAQFVIVVFYFFNFAGNHFCQALTAIAVAAAISKRQTCAKTGFKKGGIALGDKPVATGEYAYLFCHGLAK